MTEFELKHGLSQDEPGPLEPVEIAAPGVSTAEDEQHTDACPRCGGSGQITVLSDNSPDAHDVEVCCDHCQGTGAAVDAAKYLAAALSGEKYRHMQIYGEFKNFHRSLCARFGYAHDDIHFRRDLVSLEEAIASKVSAPAAGDALADPTLQKLFGEAITGALAFGAQGVAPPPVGHWLEPFWNMARADAAAAAGLALLDHPLLRDVLGYVEDAGPADVWGAAQSWMSLRDAAIAAVHPAPAAGGALTAAARDVMAERQRQIIDKGFSPDRDDGYTNRQLADAAAQYALTAAGWPSLNVWPWRADLFKAGTPREMLTKAGALVLAEIERLDRAAQRKGGA